jgi:flagellar biogenesis protein FliO
LRHPGPKTFALLGVALAIVVALIWVLRRTLRRGGDASARTA